MPNRSRDYVSVIIPWEPDPKLRTVWHPTSASHAPLSRGHFIGPGVQAKVKAHTWARKHLGPDATYTLKTYSPPLLAHVRQVQKARKAPARWIRPRICEVCRHVHHRIEEAKTNARGDAYCTNCGDLAPKLKT